MAIRKNGAKSIVRGRRWAISQEIQGNVLFLQGVGFRICSSETLISFACISTGCPDAGESTKIPFTSMPCAGGDLFSRLHQTVQTSTTTWDGYE